MDARIAIDWIHDEYVDSGCDTLFMTWFVMKVYEHIYLGV